MSHKAQKEFCQFVKNKFPNFFKNKKVIDFGSLDINGNNKVYFDNCQYVGIDLGHGKNVDIISKAHEFNDPDCSYDVVISTEMLEHDKFYNLSLVNMIRLLKSNGLFLFTCAGPGRPEHGTIKTSPNDSPFTISDKEWGNYYQNLDEGKIRDVLNIDEIFSEYQFSIASGWNRPDADLRFFGIKK